MQVPLPPSTLCLLGPTASGKTALAVALARELEAEILSVDSRQAYRELDLGSGKDREEYTSGGAPVPVHGIDLFDLGGEGSLYDYQQEAHRALQAIAARKRRALLCGGSGLYLDCLLAGYDLRPAPPRPALRAELEALDHEELRQRVVRELPGLHNETDLEDRERMLRALEVAQAGPPPVRLGHAAFKGLVIGLDRPREELRRRIGLRLRQRLEEGMREECERLLAAGHTAERLERLGLEYRWLTRWIREEITESEMLAGLEKGIRTLARRQRMWFRRMERQGLPIHWLRIEAERDTPSLAAEALEVIHRFDQHRNG